MTDTIEKLSCLADLCEEFGRGTAQLSRIGEFPLPTIYDHTKWYTAYDGSLGGACCAFGLAMFSPKFQAQGLRATTHSMIALRPQYHDAENLHAAMAFFELDPVTTNLLFGFGIDRDGRSAQDEAALIRQVVAKMVAEQHPEPEPVEDDVPPTSEPESVPVPEMKAPVDVRKLPLFARTAFMAMAVEALL
jgi:hypothetical protein